MGNAVGLLWYSELFGGAWEDRCHVFLGLKFGDDYQPITDNDGDWGLDGLNRSRGSVYQCYGLEPETKNPTKGVTDKITSDLKKLTKYEADIQSLLGDVKIKRWVLLLNKDVPSSSIHLFAKKKEKELLDSGLSILADDFQVVLKTPTYFEKENLEYEKARSDKLEFDIPRLDAPSLDAVRENSKFQAVYKKFRKISDSDDVAERFAYDEIKNFIEQDIQLDEISKRAGDLYSEIESVRRDVESDAVKGSTFVGTFASWASTSSTLEDRLDRRIGQRVGGETLVRLRKYFLADWFVRCPLDFKAKSPGQ
jgi:hypothetical protein